MLAAAPVPPAAVIGLDVAAGPAAGAGGGGGAPALRAGQGGAGVDAAAGLGEPFLLPLRGLVAGLGYEPLQVGA
jgi:hypothetical protein